MIESMDNSNVNQHAIDKWNNLNEQQRDKVVKRIYEVLGFNNPNPYIKEADRVRKDRAENGSFGYIGLIENSNPCLVLNLCDPVLSRIIQKWLFTTIEVLDDDGTVIWNDRMPFCGFFLDEVYFDKASLMKYTDEERDVINKAINIIKNRGL